MFIFPEKFLNEYYIVFLGRLEYMRKIIIVFILMQVLTLSIFCKGALIINNDPEAPEIPIITGLESGEVGQEYCYNITTSDPQNDDVYFIIRCSDCPAIYDTEYIKSGETLMFNHCWCCFYQKSNPFVIRAKAIDVKGYESDWGEFEVNLTNITIKSCSFSFINQIFRVLSDCFILNFSMFTT